MHTGRPSGSLSTPFEPRNASCLAERRAFVLDEPSFFLATPAFAQPTYNLSTWFGRHMNDAPLLLSVAEIRTSDCAFLRRPMDHLPGWDPSGILESQLLGRLVIGPEPHADIVPPRSELVLPSFCFYPGLHIRRTFPSSSYPRLQNPAVILKRTIWSARSFTIRLLRLGLEYE